MSNELDKAELRKLKDDIERVQWELNKLRSRAQIIEARIPTLPPSAVPPPIQLEPLREQAPAEEQPPLISVSSDPPPTPEEMFEPPPEQHSLEMRLGTYWFVRIGVVLVLTALVFLGNLAYQKYIPLLGPGSKITLLYLASLLFLGVGAWLPRRHEKLRNYSEVLFAAGLAAVYFTTYAAHHFPNVRVIHSEVLAGCLLLAWTAVIVFLADHRKSEPLALFGIGLAYYTSVITNVGRFTAVSNLFLAAASVWFLIRNRWLGLGFVSLAASYGTYFYWRIHSGTLEVLFESRLPLIGYWLIFTAAVFLTRETHLTSVRRAWFLSVNNAAAVALLALGLPTPFWKLAFASGAILLACSAAATRFLRDDPLPHRAYLIQGIVLITLAFITYFEGPTLALALAAESAALLVFSTQWRNNLLAIGSTGCVILAAAFASISLHNDQPVAPLHAIAIVGFFVFNTTWTRKKLPSEQAIETINSFAAVGIACAWLPSAISREPRVGVLAALALAATGYGIFIRSIPFVGASQLFLLGSSGLAISLMQRSLISGSMALAPIAGWTILAFIAHKRGEEAPIRILSFIYQTAGAFLALIWTATFVPANSRFLLTTAIATAAFLLARAGQTHFVPACIIFGVAGLVGWIMQPQTFSDFLPLAVLIAAQILYRRSPGKLAPHDLVHRLWILVAAGALWLFVSRMIISSGAGPRILTASWAGLAFGLFILGIAIREQTYRWSGLIILGASLARVVFLDIWQFETFHRILSLLAIGLVLLALGYIYTRYQEKFSKWL